MSSLISCPIFFPHLFLGERPPRTEKGRRLGPSAPVRRTPVLVELQQLDVRPGDGGAGGALRHGGGGGEQGVVIVLFIVVIFLIIC